MTHFLRGHNVSAHLTGFLSGEGSTVTTISAHRPFAARRADAANEMDALVITFTGSPAR